MKPFKCPASNGIHASLQCKNPAGGDFPKDERVLAQEGGVGAFSHACQTTSMVKRGTQLVKKGTT